MARQGEAHVSTILKQSLVLFLLLSGLAQQAQANDVPPPGNTAATAPAQAPVQLGWDRVGDRERNWV